MNKKIGSRKFSARQSAHLGAYFAAGLGASTVATSSSDAAIVNINIGPSGFNIGGINAGLSPDSLLRRTNFPLAGGGNLTAQSAWADGTVLSLTGLGGEYGFGIALSPTASNVYGYTAPNRFISGQTIDANLFGGGSYYTNYTAFSFVRQTYYGPQTFTSPDFGPGSYLGFVTATGNYGWLEVRWTTALDQFEILSGAYESEVGVEIMAGDNGPGPGPAPVPEPGTWAAAALLAGGTAFARWRKRRDAAQKEAA